MRRRRPAARRAPVRRRVVRTRSTRPKAQRTQCVCPGEVTTSTKFILAQADPFEPKSFGGKIPDSSTIPSISTPVSWNYTCSSAAIAGDNPSLAHAWAFNPTCLSAAVRSKGSTANSWLWSSVQLTDIPNASAFQTQFEATRTIAHGIRLTCPFAPTSTTGFVHVALATETYFGTSLGSSTNSFAQLATTIDQMSQYTYYQRFTLASLTQSPITLVNKWTDETAFRYSSPLVDFTGGTGAVSAAGASATFHIPLNWGTLLVVVEGASTDTTDGRVISPLSAEIMWHTENIPNKASTVIGSTAAASDPQVLSSVSRAVAQSDFAHTENGQERHMSNFVGDMMDAAGISSNDVYNAAASVARSGVGMAAGYLRQRYGIGGVNNMPNRLAIR